MANRLFGKCKLDNKTCYLDYHTGGGEVYGSTHGKWYVNSWKVENGHLMPRIHTGGLAVCPDHDPDYTSTLYVSLRLSPFIDVKEVNA